jgi:hypothetical protein
VHVWLRDIEALEAVTQDELVRSLVLRMAGLARDGKLQGFLEAIGADEDLDAETKATVRELARDKTFLLAAADYMRSMSVHH